MEPTSEDRQNYS